MPTVTFIEPDGTRRVVDARVGLSLMEIAIQHSIKGVVAQCGGACSCSTCHCYVDEAWFGRLDPMDEMEEGMLGLAPDPKPTSRLTCQVPFTAELDGIVLTVPQRQAR